LIRKLGQFFFFGNYFLGICIAMLSAETLIQCGFHSLNILYLIEVMLLTKVYYTHAITGEIKFYNGPNLRTQWYVQHRKFIRNAQKVYTTIALLILVYFLVKYFKELLLLSAAGWFCILVFPLLACMYYGINLIPRYKVNLRNYGRLKPFIIGLVATGTVTVYPIVFFSLEKNQKLSFTRQETFFFVANFMFTTVIAIMFDIKDYASDHNHSLKTLIVRFGLRKSIYYVLLPFIGIGMFAHILFTTNNNYSFIQTSINCIPFLLLAMVAWSLQQRKKILYYLAVIDGLLLVKAICGIMAVTLFK
jgi:4-hydroxybenzoate polyprenyltransferase